MKIKVRAFSKLSFFAAVLPFFLVLTLFSCNNLFSDNTKDNSSPSQPVEAKIVTISGSFVSPYAEVGQNSRSAQPAFSYSDYTNYFVKATATDVTGEVDGTVNATNKTFSIPLSLGKSWTITLGVKNAAGGEVLKAVYSIGHALEETDVTTPLTLVLEPIMTPETGRGNINLQVSFPETITKVGITGFAGETEEELTITDSSATITKTNIQSGVYTASINFYQTNVLVYSTTQIINVFDNMTTSHWVDGGTQNSPITSTGTFVLTSTAIDAFKYTNFFVASATSTLAGSNSNDGSPYAPLSSISNALSHIQVVGGGEAYTIWLMSDITENVTIPAALNDKASSITIKSLSGIKNVSGATGDGGRVFMIHTSVPVTLENLTITGGSTSSAYETGGGIYIKLGANMTLANCTVTGNSVMESSEGGGVYNGGTLKIRGKTTVTGNTKGTGSSAPESNVYLDSGNIITVVGALDPASRIGVITVTKPSYGTPYVFTTGFNTCGLSATAISTVFTSDEEYAVLASSAGEATLAASGGSVSDVFDYNVELSCADTKIAPGSIISVAAAVKKGSDTVAVTAPEDLAWNFTLNCYGGKVASMTAVAGVGYGSFRVPANLHIFGGVNYELHASAVYDGVTYDKDFKLTGYSSSVPYGFVAVTGATITGAVSKSHVFVEGGTKVIPNMYVCDHEVTQAEYLAVMGLTQQSILSEDYGLGNNYPAYNMSWFDMLVYCNKRSVAEGLTPCYMINNSTNPDNWGEVPNSPTHTNYDKWNAVICDFNADGYRLPTQAEWEYAARGGNDGIQATQTEYSGSDSLDNFAWYSANSKVNNVYSSHEVKTKEANSLGIYDMSGNVWERCWDLGTNAQGAAGRAVRGGSAGCNPVECTVYGQNYYDVPEMHKNDDGFRVVRTAPGTPLASGTSGTAGTDATYMYFGEWPQTIKADGVTVNESVSKERGMFTYYLGSDGAWYAKQAENGYASAADSTYSDGTPVAQGGTSDKYFKVEPIKWRVLTTNYNGTGEKLLLAENILTNGTYHPSETRTIDGVTVYHHNWQYSRIRAYLNGTSYNLSGTQNNEFEGKGFLQTAFTSSLQSKIVTSLLDNSAATAPENTPEAYLCENTYDNVFFLSVFERISYGLNNTTSVRAMTDFAKATGACGDWWLRTPHSGSTSNPYVITAVGGFSCFNATYGYHGIVPALCIDD